MDTKNKVIVLMALAVIGTIILSLVFWLLLLLGGNNNNNMYILRYGDHSIRTKILLLANTVQISGGLETMTRSQWVRAADINIDQNKVNLKISGKVSLCQAYLPLNNLMNESNQNDNSKPIAIPRFRDTDSLQLKFPANKYGWYNLAKISKNDYVRVTLNPTIKDSQSSNVMYQDPFNKTSQIYDCSEGSSDNYDAVCGLYAPQYWYWECKEADNKTSGPPQKVKRYPYLYNGTYNVKNIANVFQTKPSCSSGTKIDRKNVWFTTTNIIGLESRLVSLDGKEIQPASDVKNIHTSMYNNGQVPILMNHYTTLSEQEAYLQYRFKSYNSNNAKATGGYIFNIQQTKSKCVMQNGESHSDTGYPNRGQILYVIDSSKNPNSDLSVAQNAERITFDKDNRVELNTKDKSGSLWLKIDNKLEDVKDSQGVYNIDIDMPKTEKVTFISRGVEPLLQYIKNTFVTSGKTMFRNMLCMDNSSTSSCISFFTYIRAILTLYIMYYGFMFLLGMQNISLEDLVYTSIKVVIVAGLMNETTFNLFDVYIFDSLINTTDQLIANLSGYSPASEHPASAPFMFLNTVFTKILFDKLFMAQYQSLMFMGLFGFGYMLILFLAIVFMIISAFRALCIYIMAIFAITLLIGIAPLFITFVLFPVTRSLFDHWWKFLIRYMLEPVIVIGGLTILVHLFTVYLDAFLDFSVVWRCAIPITLDSIIFPLSFLGDELAKIFGVKLDWNKLALLCLPWWQAWGVSHLDSPSLNIYFLIGLLILGYIMYHYVSFASDVASKLFEGGSASASAAGSKMSSSIGQAIGNRVGMDKKTMQNDWKKFKSNPRKAIQDFVLNRPMKTSQGKYDIRVEDKMKAQLKKKGYTDDVINKYIERYKSKYNRIDNEVTKPTDVNESDNNTEEDKKE